MVMVSKLRDEGETGMKENNADWCEKNCPYFPDCGGGICNFVLALLKEHEPVKPVEKWDHGFYYACGSCWEEFGIVREYPSYCPCCGKKVKWDG